jgi:hypothetical protein
MFIPDPGYEFFYPRSGVKKIPDPGSESASKNLSIFNPKICFQALGKMIWDVHPGSGFFPIPDPWVKKAPEPGSESATLFSPASTPATRHH